MPLPASVAGYFWPDAEHPEVGMGGRSPLGVVVDRVRAQVEDCRELARDEGELLLRIHGLSGAVARIDSVDASSSLVYRAGPAVAGGRVGGPSGVSRRLAGAYARLARTLEPRPPSAPTVPVCRGDPTEEPWFIRASSQRFYLPDVRRDVVDAALQVAYRWCGVGGERQEELWSALGWWEHRFRHGMLPQGVRNSRRLLWRANAYMGIALYQVVKDRALLDQVRARRSWSRLLPTVPRVLAVGPIEVPTAPAALTDPLVQSSSPAPEDVVRLGSWVQHAMRDGVRVVAEGQLLDVAATRALDRLSDRDLAVVVRTLTDVGAHHDELIAMSDRWLQVSIDRQLRFPEWLTAVVNTSVASSAKGSFSYANRVLGDAVQIAQTWEPPPTMNGEFDVSIERLEQIQQLLVGQAAWRRRAAQRIIETHGDPHSLDRMVHESLHLGHEATRKAAQLGEALQHGRPTTATAGWVLGAVLRVMEPMAIACYADAHLGGEYRLDRDERDAFARLRRSMDDVVEAALDLPALGLDSTTQVRLATIRELDERIAEGEGALTIGTRERVSAATA
jgi:hypothetical protein